MIAIKHALHAEHLRPEIERMWSLSAPKIMAIDAAHSAGAAAPVYTVHGKYTARGWTEWTEGFAYGSALLQFDATGDRSFLELGRKRTIERMANHVTHAGVHDHGFNNISTYGNLWRMAKEETFAVAEHEIDLYELALKASGAVQAMRWTFLASGEGFIYSFNGPHSLFADTLRSLRSLALAHQLGHCLTGERDEKISLLRRLVEHARATAKWSVYYGAGRDLYDVRGRVAHESVFNVNDGTYRCPNSQQGYSPFTTWTRGLAWIICGFAELLEWMAARSDDELDKVGGREAIEAVMLNAARATADFYIEQTPTDGIPYWDTGAPNLHRLGDYLTRPADPWNDYEPVDSSAAAIAAQGLLRLGKFLAERDAAAAQRYWDAGLTISETLFAEPYLSTDPAHHGLLLHSVYHRPNGWDHIGEGRRVPAGESSMWGDYHLRELALFLQRAADDGRHLAFFAPQFSQMK
ncbi:MAG TPA: glycosyl hydrolase [Chthoniobacteraceae bacterium]|nr:glycosyl hydrolase [Chthoniobacteraceae bacterium]